MYKCPNCGGEIAFLPESGIIKCEYCGSEFSPETIREQDLQKTRKTAEEHTLDGGRVYVCTQCGANIYTTEETGVRSVPTAVPRIFWKAGSKERKMFFPI